MKNKQSQIEKGFQAFTNHTSSFFNPPLADPSQQTLKDNLDRAFDSINIYLKGKFGEAILFPDEEMVNIIQMAFMWYQDITSVDKAVSIIKCVLDSRVSDGIKRIGENTWMIKNVDALNGVSHMLTERYKTLSFKR